MSVISSAYISRIFCNDCVPYRAPLAIQKAASVLCGQWCAYIAELKLRKYTHRSCIWVVDPKKKVLSILYIWKEPKQRHPFNTHRLFCAASQQSVISRPIMEFICTIQLENECKCCSFSAAFEHFTYHVVTLCSACGLVGIEYSCRSIKQTNWALRFGQLRLLKCCYDKYLRMNVPFILLCRLCQHCTNSPLYFNLWSTECFIQ